MSVLTDRLIATLQSRLPQQPMNVGGAGGVVVVFRAAHSDVGDIEVHDNGDELIVMVGSFTHTHFSSYDHGLSISERAQRIADDVVAFLEDVFSDRIEFFGSDTGAGGWRKRRPQKRGILSKLVFGGKTYVWSGPVANDS